MKILKWKFLASFIIFLLSMMGCFIAPKLPFDLQVYDGVEEWNVKRLPLSISSKDFTFISIFAEPDQVCRLKVYPGSSISIIEAKRGYNNPFWVKVGGVLGIVEFTSVNCIVEFGFFSTTTTQAVVRFTSAGVEILEGGGSYKGKTLTKLTGVNEKGIYTLPSAPSVVFPRDSDEFSTFYFSWLSVESAKKYFVEIALDENFQNPVLFAEVSENRFLPSRVSIKPISGVYFWRVWYYDGEKMSDYRRGKFKIR